jgi:hypothetical protein
MEQKQSKVNYQKGVVYNVWYEDELFYTGSTTHLINRKSKHKRSIKNKITEWTLPFHKAIKELNIPFENLRFEEYEKYPCNSKPELEKREGEIQRILKPKYIGKIAGRTKKEYYLENKEKIIERNKKYRKDDPEKAYIQNKKYYEKNIDKIKEYREQTVECDCETIVKINKLKRHKETQKHKDLMQNIVSRYKKNKCECGCTITKSGMYKHRLTEKHLKLMENKTSVNINVNTIPENKDTSSG